MRCVPVTPLLALATHSNLPAPVGVCVMGDINVIHGKPYASVQSPRCL